MLTRRQSMDCASRVSRTAHRVFHGLPESAPPSARTAGAWFHGLRLASSGNAHRLLLERAETGACFCGCLVLRLVMPRRVFALSSSRLRGRSSSSSLSSPESSSSPMRGGSTWMAIVPAGAAGPWPMTLTEVPSASSGPPPEAERPARSSRLSPSACWRWSRACRSWLVRCSMMPRYCIMLLSLTPVDPIISDSDDRSHLPKGGGVLVC
mmetsp:Transcript_43773/g.103026  ORF Transcript_43773/g.103026 Transcript_43773/m.103026 type:complete len:209 (-) Transcript_43773:23-649(-)